MNYTLTTTISAQIYNFLEQEQKIKKTSKKAIIEEALKLYKKEKLKQEIAEGLKERNAEYQQINNEFSQAQTDSLHD